MKTFLKLGLLSLGLFAQCAFGQTALTTVSDSAVRIAAGQGLFTGSVCFTSPPMVFNSVTYAASSQPACKTITNGVFPATQFVPNGVTGVVAAGYNDFYTALWRNAAGSLIRTEMWVVPPSSVSLKVYQVQKSTLSPILTYLLTTKGDDIACCAADGFAVRVPVGANGTVKVADSSTTYGWVWKTLAQLQGFASEPAITSGNSNQYFSGLKTWVDLNTTAVPEGTRVYHTPERVRASLTAVSPIVFDDLTGTFSCPTCGTGTGSGDTVAPATNTDLYFPRWSGSNSKTLSNGLQATGNGSRLVTSTGTRTPSNLASWDADGNAVDSTLPFTSVLLSSSTYADPAWLTSLAKSKVGLSSVENTAISTWAGSANITTLGTVVTGAFPYSLVTGKPSTFSPSTHAASHQNGGADEVATATPAANVIPKAGGAGTIAAGFIPAALDASKIADGSVSSAEFQRINSVTSNVQDQIDALAGGVTSPAALKNATWCPASSGSGTVYTCVTSVGGALSVGQTYFLQADIANTGNVTFTVNSGSGNTAKSVIWPGGDQLEVGELGATAIAEVVYNGTAFELQHAPYSTTPGKVRLGCGSAPSTPPSGVYKVYCEGGAFKGINDAGTVVTFGAGGSSGGTAVAPYSTTVTSQTSVSITAVTHGQGTLAVPECFDNSTPRLAVGCSFTRNTSGDLVFAFAPAFTGQIQIGSGGGTSITPYSSAITAQTSVSISAATHGKGTTPRVDCFNSSSPARLVSCEATRNGSGDLVFAFNPAFTGTIEIRY